MKEQQHVAAFIDEHGLSAPPAYRLLDLTAEVGELAADAAKSSAYGARPDRLAVEHDELGDALFSLLALAEALDIDASEALDDSIAKYERRIDAHGMPGSED